MLHSFGINKAIFIVGNKLNPFKPNGFTIVELLIIVAVIAILASITIVSYNAVTKNSREQSVTADLQTVASTLTKAKAENGSFPDSANFSAIEKANTSGDTSYSYVFDTVNGTYCLEATAYGRTFHLTGTNAKVVEGDCAAAGTVTVINRMRDPSVTTLPTANMTITGVSIGTPVIVNNASQAHSGNTFLRVPITGSGSSVIEYTLSSTAVDSTLLPNTPYTLSAKIRPSKALVFNAQFTWTNSSGTTQTDSPTVINATANAWTTLAITGQSATPVTVKMRVSTASGSNWANGDTLDLDSLMLTEGTTIYQYKDGSYSGWSWTGAANNSRSAGPTVPGI